MYRFMTYLLVFSAIVPAALFSQITITGKIYKNELSKGLPQVSVSVKGKNISTQTDDMGNYSLNLPAVGEYILLLKQAGTQSSRRILEETIKVSETINIFNVNFNWSEVKIDPIVVYGASRRAEKITESPAAVTAIFNDELEKSSRSGQLAASLASNAGVDVLRNGANDFIVNTRGFSSGLNRRILVLQDGRDVAMPLLGALEWNSFSLPQEDFERMELIKGPAASLYGANAFNGVLLLTSFAPRDVLGTKVSVLAGDYSTLKADVRHAGAFGDFSYKINFGHSSMQNMISRRDSAKFLEYPGLPIEKKVLSKDEKTAFSTYGTLRIDYGLTPQSGLTTEFGYSRSGNEAYVFGLGRTFVRDAERPFARLSYNSQNINFHAHYMSRFTPQNMWLMVPNAPLRDNSKDIMFDFQNNFSILPTINFIWGVTEQLQYIRTYGTSIPNDVDADFTGVYSQAEWQAAPKLKLVGSLRFDYASIHPAYFSPRAAIVYSPWENHQFRFSLNSAFQRPNYSELYRLTPDAPAISPITKRPVNFAQITNVIADSISALSGTKPILDLNLDAMRAKAIGNKDLQVEKILSYEFGYKGTYGNNLFISMDFYYNKLNDFITNFLPQVNTNIKAWSPNLPDSLSAYSSLVKNMVLASLSPRDAARLSEYEGEPVFAVSNANVGKVDEYGVEVELVYQPIERISIKTGYSYFGYKVIENKSSQPLLPNTAPHRANISLAYSNPKKYDAELALQYSDSFKWLAGTYFGKVPAYAVVSLNFGMNITRNLTLGMNIFNLFNTKHYQIFGGTYLPRQATARLSWEF